MSEKDQNRPRRAFAAEEATEPVDQLGPDDTAADSAPTPRRGGGAPAESDGSTILNPFARPGSEDAMRPVAPGPRSRIAEPVLPDRDSESQGEPVVGRRASAVSADEVESVAPRRSAMSSVTPPEPSLVPPPSGTTATTGSWVGHHRKRLALWLAIGLVAVLLAVGGAYYAARLRGPGAAVTNTATATASVTPSFDATVENLITPDDASLIVPQLEWVVADTVETRDEITAKVACLASDPADLNPTATLQRTLGSTDSTQPAVLHQIDTYVDEAAAEQVMAARLQQLSACDLVPAHILSAYSFPSAGDEAVAFNVVYEEQVPQHHTIVLVRTGRTLSFVDAKRNTTALQPQPTVQSIQRSLRTICQANGGTCPAGLTASQMVPPATEPIGWLVPADLPRPRPGFGMWSGSLPADIASSGTGCENITMATVSGPTARQQRTYSLLQDPLAPTTFGIDELTFTFPDAAQASTFAANLTTNIASCKERMLTATVAAAPDGTGAGANQTPVAAKVFNLTQATASSKVTFMVGVVTAGPKVTYLLMSNTGFSLSAEAFTAVAVRAGQRATQSD